MQVYRFCGKNLFRINVSRGSKILPSPPSHSNLGGILRSVFRVVGEGEGEVGLKLSPPPTTVKLVRIMLESSNLARKYTPISHMQFLENMSFSIKPSLTFLMLAFFQKITVFWQKQYLYAKQSCESC